MTQLPSHSKKKKKNATLGDTIAFTSKDKIKKETVITPKQHRKKSFSIENQFSFSAENAQGLTHSWDVVTFLTHVKVAMFYYQMNHASKAFHPKKLALHHGKYFKNNHNHQKIGQLSHMSSLHMD